MAKKSKHMKHSKSVQVTAARNPVNGFDYGCLPKVMTVSDLDFPAQLSSASVVGATYGRVRSDALGRVIPTLSLIAENRTPIVNAFQAFNRWADATDPDSLELTIVFLNTEGYLLAIGPEPSRLKARCLRYDRSHQVTEMMSALWIKPIDSVHRLLREFQAYCRSPIAPGG